jgi:hypothetical protein
MGNRRIIKSGIITTEIAEALGARDCILGIDSEARNITISRFRGRRRLTRAYWQGWLAADKCLDLSFEMGRVKCFADMRGHAISDIEETAAAREAGRLN